MAENNHSPFFDLINKMFDHVSKIEPRVAEIEWKVRFLWWAICAIGGGIGAVCVAVLIEFLKKKVVG